MNSMKVASQRIIYTVAVFAMLIALVLPAIASAAQITTRSIAASSASITAPAGSVSYEITFTPAGNAGAFVVEFCDSPLLGQPCTPPTGMNLAAATTPTAGVAIVGTSTANKVTATKTMTPTEQTIVFANLTNPSVKGTSYARIATYADATTAQEYESTDVGDIIDEGGVAMAFTDNIQVSGTVLETLTFCASNVAITDNCGASVVAPEVNLGDQVDTTDVYAMAPGNLYEDSIYVQLSTNASGGAIVRLKSSTTGCGGLMRAGATLPDACGVLPALATGIDEEANEAKFGVRVDAAGDYATPAFAATSSGSLSPNAYYNNQDYRLNYVSGDASGVTSTYGDPFLETEGDPVTHRNMQVWFGAAVSNNTAAGSYSADMSMIAVGKF